MTKAILYRATGKTSKEEAKNFLEKYVKPVDKDAEIKQDDTSKGESWVVLGTQKIARKPTVVQPRSH